MATPPRSEVALLFGGEAGQGLQTLQTLMLRLLSQAGWHVFAASEFMSRIRGGSNSVTLRAAPHPVNAWCEKVDLCLILDPAALPRLQGRFGTETVVVGDPRSLGEVAGMIPLPLQELSKAAGGVLFANAIACGFLARLLGLDRELLNATVASYFGDSANAQSAANLAATRHGWEAAAPHAGCCALLLPSQPRAAAERPLLLDGSAAVALGALAGGCNFIASYPMSPSTGVLIHLARQARTHGVVVEQAEDEIAAINMALGSWYAGGRALVSTSGGGFDLMTEGLSLCGAIESPLVIHLAQRPGPATGLPTRSEQGDLELARYGGHGEFPRAILAPGTLEDAFLCAAHAFAMADASQSPVILLTDQFLLDSVYDIPDLPLADRPPETQIVVTAADYQRYAPSVNGVSPRGIPGLGAGLVCVDSDEHDAQGCITEDFAVRTAMVDKRLAKGELLRFDLALPPRLYGPADFTSLIVGFGSTYGCVREALARVDAPHTAFLYCPQVYPLPAEVVDALLQAQIVIVIENNATGQFARLLRAETGRGADRQWLKYNGLPFSVEEVVAHLQEEDWS
ncbi:MAG: hypothetical protein A2091_00500 [Desulfuromonadales bacterium GWD2_61_12]|nr:MAG: hypothetical protein A2005_08525 [Desulfuromonadales bacterium GWC2_61_20]OGR32745.1 MAG: hypothetical protein A2091_00500 [Desulfuromonadales bacterium GWD2_61_12]HAD03161.1 2-oxoacid:acceptor oxidoreductase subunit alpha [Desulfuromonas sp.]HBT83345.1 2-oxoacid:acceptor oxidoreductase subunit alpha [Desulfuromonas sp.]